MIRPDANGSKTAEPPAQEAAGAVGDTIPGPESPPRSPIGIIARRADFLRAASARRQPTPSFLLQARARGDNSPAIRVGFTASRKTGNAVTRNRARRRLREAARALLPRLGQPGWDYVLVARPGATVSRPFALLLADLESALAAVHRPRPPRPPSEAREQRKGEKRE